MSRLGSRKDRPKRDHAVSQTVRNHIASIKDAIKDELEYNGYDPGEYEFFERSLDFEDRLIEILEGK